MKLALILGNQLHRDHPALIDKSVDIVLMIESQNICNKLNYHKHKIIFVLSAMRHYAKYAEPKSKKLLYLNLEDTPDFFEALSRVIQENHINSISYMRPANLGTEMSLKNFANKNNLDQQIYPNQLFMTPRQELDGWLDSNPKSNMESFYRWQRRRTEYLMDNDKPVGEKWNYDHENRKPLPKGHEVVDKVIAIKPDTITTRVMSLVDKYFDKNPGKSDNFWLPVTFEQGDKWLDDFVRNRLEFFGKYEDAMDKDEVFLYHSVLSPLLNVGLISTNDCVQKAIDAYNLDKAPLAGVEGFVRQIIGWREYMNGMYTKMPDFRDMNYFGFNKQLEPWWYETNSEEHLTLPMPVQKVLKRTHDFGYNHHIERLMVLGNWFLLNSYNPESVYKWFSAMYVDAYEWVMVPNVIGMSQYADGGKVATKPYISGGNYLSKMGRWGDATSGLDEFTRLYWEFLSNNYDKLKTNPRMSLVLKLSIDKQ